MIYCVYCSQTNARHIILGHTPYCFSCESITTSLITVYTDSSTGTALVELGEGYIINLSEGTHTYVTPTGSHNYSCVTTVTVVSNITGM